jgi:malonate-semialdehyde dehydrogenase (acetylating) / methylmalonate-semialdehyde dehydrogenase
VCVGGGSRAEACAFLFSTYSQKLFFQKTKITEVVEYAANLAPALMGGFTEHVATGMDTFSIRQPLGVCAGVCPFNFPAMIPLWMFPLAVTAGNTFVLKPSERDPGAAMALADLAQQAGLPPGVLNVVHGGVETVNALCDHPGIAALSFVGSTPGGRAVYARASAAGKRAQVNMGAKNHAVVLTDAHEAATLSALTGAAFGAAGQRCMAISAAVFVGEPGVSDRWVAGLADRARTLVVGAGHLDGTDVGPMISPVAKARAERLIGEAVGAGARAVVDGRGVVVPGFEAGNFLGPTLLAGVSPSMSAYTEEIFGPVLVCLEARTLDDAIALVNANPFGNGTALFTRSGAAARRFQAGVEVGMVGINVPIPVPLPFHSFTGWKASFAGDLPMYGAAGVEFFTRTKTVTTNWRDADEAAGGRAAGLDGVGASVPS